MDVVQHGIEASPESGSSDMTYALLLPDTVTERVYSVSKDLER